MSRDSATRPKRRPGRRLAACALAVLGLVGLGTGSASQVSLVGTAVAAGSAMIASCQGAAPITASFTTTWTTTPTPAAYRATQVKLSNVAADCSGLTYQIQLTNGGSAVGTELSGLVSLTAGVLTVDIPSTPVTSIGGVAVVIRS